MTNHILLSETVTPTFEPSDINRRQCYVSNLYPRYEHKPGAKSPPRIILAMRKAARENRPSQHILWHAEYRYHPLTQKPLMEKRSMNLHRKRAIDAIAECIAANVNIVTCKVHMSLAQMSDACGLTTYNAQGVPSYSRASRAITQHFEAIGAVRCERV